MSKTSMQENDEEHAWPTDRNW